MSRLRRGYGVEYLRNKIELKCLLKGTCLEGMNCHHIVPFCVSRDNSIKNLCFIPTDKHDALHREEKEYKHINTKGYRRLAQRFGGVGIDLE